MEPLRQKDPKTIGPYTLIGRLGAGGMGIVYLASKGSESVALKVVRESLIDHPSELTRFAREIQALEAINSPYVAKILGSGVEGDQAWFATEFVNGPDLKSLVSDKGPLDEERWQFLADGVLKGLEAIHSAGVIHRDIKPGNIIMSEAGPKIIDFGIAQVSDATSVTSSGLVAGSPAWFSPEQIEGQVLTSATDLFSAGSVLVYAATGSSPWGDETTITRASVFKILTAEPNLEGLSINQRSLVESLMAREPRDRGIGKVVSLTKNDRNKSTSTSEATPAPKKSVRSRKIFDRKNVGMGVIGVLAIAAASIGVMSFLPSSGPAAGEALAACTESEISSLRKELGEALTLYSDWSAAFVDSGASYRGRLNLDEWASRYANYRESAQRQLAKVMNTRRGLHPILDDELDRIIERGNSNLYAIQTFVDYSNATRGSDFDQETFWRYQDDAGPSAELSFRPAAISQAAAQICESNGE